MSMEIEKERLTDSKLFANNTAIRQREITEDDIRNDEAFGEAYTIVNSYLNPQEVETNQAPRMKQGQEDYQEQQAKKGNAGLAERGMQLVSDFKNALYTADEGLGLAGTYAKFKDAPPEVKQAAYYMWDSYNRADDTWAAFGRGLKSMGKDPSTYTPAVGFKFFGKAAAQKLLEKKFTTMLLSGTTAGAFTGGEEFVRQEVQDVEDKDFGAIAKHTGIGFVVGTLIPPTIDVGVKGVKKAGQAISNVIQEGDELMAQQAGGGTPPKIEPARKEGESIGAFLQRKKAFYDENPEMKPKENIITTPQKPNKEDIISKFNDLKSFENFTDGMKRTILDIPYTTPKTKIYRGESENSGTGMAMFGSGLYSTTNRKLAQKYGKVREVNLDELPKNPIQFETELDFKQFEYELSRVLGIDKRDITENIGQIDDYLKEMGYDGMSVGKGKDRFFVTFPQRGKE